MIVIWFAWFPILEYFLILHGPKNLHGPILQGTGDLTVETSGQFDLGGYINFKVDPHEYSINGFYHAVYDISPSLDNELKNRGFEWFSLTNVDDKGYPWGDKIHTWTRGQNPDLSVPHPEIPTIDIPNEPALLGKVIPINFNIDLLYPIEAGTRFSDNKESANGTLEIQIDHNRGSIKAVDFFDIDHLSATGGIWFKIAVISLFGGTFTVLPLAIALSAKLLGLDK